MKDPQAVKEFTIDKSAYEVLTKDELEILPILIKASKLLADIYLEQEKGHSDYPGANLYPPDISDYEIEKATLNDPEILSPYTVVESGPKGLVATPFHLKFRGRLSEISNLLQKASYKAKNKLFARYLRIASESLLNGNYRRMDEAWLDDKNSNLTFLIGPYERYLDKRFFKKMAYLSFVGIKDPYYTQQAEKIYKILSTTVGDKPHKYPTPARVQIYSIRNLIFSGFLAQALFMSEHIPSDDTTIQQSGSRLIGYLSSMDYKFNNLLYPIFKSIFEKRFQQSYSEDLLRRGNYYLVFVTGLARQLHRFEGTRERLKQIFPIVEEINSLVSGNQHCKHLVMKGVITQKELEAIIIMHICWWFSEWILAKKSNVREDYLKGDMAALNFLIKEGALHEKDGISWPNFAKIFFEMENLANILTDLLQEGTYQEAKEFLSRYLSPESFKAFDKRLSKVKPL